LPFGKSADAPYMRRLQYVLPYQCLSIGEPRRMTPEGGHLLTAWMTGKPESERREGGIDRETRQNSMWSDSAREG
jgi:hypothetical protein